ncbi:MAG: pectate lyase [Fidelibacterota bacterium]
MIQRVFKILNMVSRTIVLPLVALLMFVPNEPLNSQNYEYRTTEQTTQSELWADLLAHEADWYASPEAIRIAENVLLYQRSSGGWPKNIDYTELLSAVQKKELRDYTDEPLATIDNGATYTQMRYLAKVYAPTKDKRYCLAFLKGLDYLLKAQYENGGWPQYYPLRKGYYSHITYNDDAMVGVMRLLRDIAAGRSEYRFVDEKRRSMAQKAVAKGIECILKTQVVVNGELTAWCAQHDVATLKPARGRAYELPSLSGKETVGIIRFLMGIENPSQQVIEAVESAVDWLQMVKIEGIRRKIVPNHRSPTGYDKVVVPDPGAPPIWARFYQIGTNRPFFSDRDGKMYFHLADISLERRVKYGWLGYWPQELLENDYPRWNARYVAGKHMPEQ